MGEREEGERLVWYAEISAFYGRGRVSSVGVYIRSRKKILRVADDCPKADGGWRAATFKDEEI